jgi:hypothetical protein
VRFDNDSSLSGERLRGVISGAVNLLVFELRNFPSPCLNYPETVPARHPAKVQAGLAIRLVPKTNLGVNVG